MFFTVIIVRLRLSAADGSGVLGVSTLADRSRLTCGFKSDCWGCVGFVSLLAGVVCCGAAGNGFDGIATLVVDVGACGAIGMIPLS